MLSFLEEFRTNPFLGILRGVEISQLGGIAEAARSAGLRFIEITMNTPGAPDLIRAMRRITATMNMTVGAGTVRSVNDLHTALHSGAQFIVSPAFQPAVSQACRQASVPYLPGALTPTEIQLAFENGASLIKVFPAQALGGPSYIRELRGPFRDIPLMACGGVSPDNIADYFRSGVDGVAFGSSIFRTDWINARRWDDISAAISALRAARSLQP